MDIKAIKDLAQRFSSEELNRYATELEEKGSCSVHSKDDPGDTMSDLLQAAEVKQMVESGMPLSEAVREFSKRVRTVLS